MRLNVTIVDSNGSTKKQQHIGRPRAFTKKLGDKICSEIAEGDSLRTICLSPKMPHKATVFRRLRINETFRDEYTCACKERVEALIESSLDIADDGINDWMEKRFGNNVEMVVNREVACPR